jgi:Phage Tail Collar Domain
MSPSSFRTLAVKGWRAVWFAVVATTAIGTAAAVDVPVTDFQGAWAADVTYAPGAIVTYQGASYISIAQSTHFAPATHPGYWKVMDSAGAVGPAGPPGPQGPAGPAGPPGTTGIFGSNSISYTNYDGAAPQCALGALLLFTGTVIPTMQSNYLPADGRLMPVMTNTALFTLLGTTYGGDGVNTFALPDLRSAAPSNTIYLICINGTFP